MLEKIRHAVMIFWILQREELCLGHVPRSPMRF